jgi:hypothetical protein
MAFKFWINLIMVSKISKELILIKYTKFYYGYAHSIFNQKKLMCGYWK